MNDYQAAKLDPFAPRQCAHWNSDGIRCRALETGKPGTDGETGDRRDVPDNFRRVAHISASLL
jgi:hypothetical protein